MRYATALCLAFIASVTSETCSPSETRSGCKIYGTSCSCGYGCKSEYNYSTRAACLKALRQRASNSCFSTPCQRGICIQTVQEPGYNCKCEGTGFYGQRCEKDNNDDQTWDQTCPTVPMRGLVFPHECIVI